MESYKPLLSEECKKQNITLDNTNYISNVNLNDRHDSDNKEKYSNIHNKSIQKLYGDDLKKKNIWAYGIGHFLNDICACIWFFYLPYYLIEIIGMKHNNASYIFLCGQISDALATPLVGLLSDKYSTKFGKRFPWYISGSIIVTISFSLIFFFVIPFKCSEFVELIYYCLFASLFNIGWAAVQVSHMALLPSITINTKKKDLMTKIRTGFTFTAQMITLSLSFVFFYLVKNKILQYQLLAGFSISIGIISSLFFLSNCKEWDLSKNIGKYLDNILALSRRKKKNINCENENSHLKENLMKNVNNINCEQNENFSFKNNDYSKKEIRDDKRIKLNLLESNYIGKKDNCNKDDDFEFNYFEDNQNMNICKNEIPKLEINIGKSNNLEFNLMNTSSKQERQNNRESNNPTIILKKSNIKENKDLKNTGKYCFLEDEDSQYNSKTNYYNFNTNYFLNMPISKNNSELISKNYLRNFEENYEIREEISKLKHDQYLEKNVFDKIQNNDSFCNSLIKNDNLINPIEKKKKIDWIYWLKKADFYYYIFVYMFVRLSINITSIVIPFYMEFVLKFPKTSEGGTPYEITICLLISTIGSIFNSIYLQKYFEEDRDHINKKNGMNNVSKNNNNLNDKNNIEFLKQNKRLYLILVSFFFIALGCLPLFILNSNIKYSIYFLSFLWGIGFSQALSCVSSLTNDVVGKKGNKGAFVYGTFSFADKLSCGIVLVYYLPFANNNEYILRYSVPFFPPFAVLFGILFIFGKILFSSKNQHYLNKEMNNFDYKRLNDAEYSTDEISFENYYESDDNSILDKDKNNKDEIKLLNFDYKKENY